MAKENKFVVVHKPFKDGRKYYLRSFPKLCK